MQAEACQLENFFDRAQVAPAHWPGWKTCASGGSSLISLVRLFIETLPHF